jgi:hypothetical protein
MSGGLQAHATDRGGDATAARTADRADFDSAHHPPLANASVSCAA